MPSEVCLQVVKFSYATGVSADNSIPWTHLTASDIFVIIEGVQSSNTPLLMRVVQGTATLEDLDVGAYIEAALDARHGAQNVGVEATVDQLPIFGITKEALLALRYKQQDGQARRLQLRMTKPADCKTIVEIFETRGMEFQTQRPSTARRPGTAASDSSRPMTARQGPPRLPNSQGDLQARPGTARHVSPHFHPPAKSHPFHSQAVPIGGLSNGPANAGEHSLPPNVLARRSASPEHSPSRPSMPPPRLLGRDEYATPVDSLPSRPSMAALYRSHTFPSQHSQLDEQDHIDRRISDHTGSGSRPTSPYRSTLDAIPEDGDARLAEHESSEMPPPTLRPSSSAAHLRSGSVERSDSCLESDGQLGTLQPVTSAATSLPSDTLEHEIPPRRELPFKRPGSKHSGSAGSRPGSALDLPPLKKPTVACENPISPSKAFSGSRPGSASPLKRSFDVMADPDPQKRPQTAICPLASRESSPRRPVSPANNPLDPPTIRQPSRMDALLYGKGTLSERSANIRRVNSTMDADFEPELPVASPSKRPYAASGNENDRVVGTWTDLPSATKERGQDGTLADFAGQSMEDRAAAMDDFMCENIDNPAFKTLCEDVENCWRRVGLGL